MPRRRIDRRNVTVIVPTLNESSGIARFLGSIPADVSVVMVDSSTDDTPDIARAVHPNVEVLSVRCNIATARQLGSQHARTEWLLFTDADVVFSPNYFSRLDAMEVGEDVGGIVGTKSTVAGFDAYHRWFRRGQACLHRVGIPAATGSNLLIRAEALRQAGGFDPALSVNEDTEVMFRVNRAKWRVPLAADLDVQSFDHRRLERGVARKLVHGALRNTALYLGLFDGMVRKSDWGYWSAGEPAPDDSAVSDRLV